MAININNNVGGGRATPLDTNRSQDKENGVSGRSGTQQSDSAVAQDAVVLTDQAKSLGRIEQGLKSGAPDNSEKIAALKQAINDGTYQVDAEQVAKKMGSFEGQMNALYE